MYLTIPTLNFKSFMVICALACSDDYKVDLITVLIAQQFKCMTQSIIQNYIRVS